GRLLAGRDRHRRGDRRGGDRDRDGGGDLRGVPAEPGHGGQRQRRSDRAHHRPRSRRLITRGASSVHIDWASLATVAVVAAAAALTIVLLISFAVVAVSRPQRRAAGPDGETSITHAGV